MRYLLLPLLFLIACNSKPLPNQEMIDLLKAAAKEDHNPNNPFSPEATIEYCDSIIKSTSNPYTLTPALIKKANAFQQLGQEQKAIDIYEALLNQLPHAEADQRQHVTKDLALAWLRLGDRTNCINNHAAESCIFPIAGTGIHSDRTGAEKAIELYQSILRKNPSDLESQWLLNIAYMSTDGYPSKVPPQFLLKVKDDDTARTVSPFVNVAMNIGVNYKCIAGGTIVDDFNNDGYPDIVMSSWSLTEPMRYYRNNRDGSFTDVSDSSGLGYLTGGLHIMQTDYNNDGYKDIFVLRGGWKGRFGKNPNSLLRNNGDGTFTDVTKASGLLSFHPSQTATWADFNNDGWLDVFIGNETTPGEEPHPCQLFINNKNGTFTEMAAAANCAIVKFVKGVTSADYDNDGRTDIFLSTLNGNKILLKNTTAKGGPVKFEDVSESAGLTHNLSRTFPAWFWDYDNDGWPDILVCGYEFTRSLSYYAAAEALQQPLGNTGKVFLFRNRHDGTFEDVSSKTGLNSTAFAMGSNFGDIDNDGYPDFYLGTGNPQLSSAVPNKLFKNVNGDHFLDVTISARVGNLQKGHAVSFADLDNDGNEDIYIKMGGAYTGDAFENSLYLNTSQNTNHWVNLVLTGNASNKAAIGARIRLTFKDHNILRSVYKDVNTGGSFGSNPLAQHIGTGAAATIDKAEITWPVTGKTQTFYNLPTNTNIKITEGDTTYSTYTLTRFDLRSGTRKLLSCSPK
ncbi:MAG: CRTAC1 family protein [Bacteroidetes bacterium]|nr:CRTAC1 family protein [Bacteroidota bacterium]